MAVDGELSEAVVLVIGLRSENHPGLDYAALGQRFGAAQAQELARRVEKLVEELGAIEIDWTKHDLASGGKEARRRLAGGHPELSEEALEALEWKFTFDWR